ncbi:peptidoglycan-binding protein [Herbaspirillum autotrophicum]|uniref:peptidoglycan-binding protein n=1 Tax=Herbaspirillum autotrophicum TaxID=180195 RepID=UPI000AD1451B|nr:peptidoglycan-binding protein [Herbaspirillum autotrophicum]
MKKFSTATPWSALLLLLASCLAYAAATPEMAEGQQRYRNPVDDPRRPAAASPHIRYGKVPDVMTAPIRAQQILPFLEQSLEVAAQDFARAPQIVAGQDGRVILGTGDRIYVHGDLGGHRVFQLFRTAQALTDPVTSEVLAHDAVWLGTARLQGAVGTRDELHVFTIVEARQEIGIGDHLLPVTQGIEKVATDYHPHAPPAPVDARVISIRSGSAQSGQHQIVILNKGAADKIDQGTMLNVYRRSREVGRHDGANADPRLPERLTATMLIFKVSERIAYGLIMKATEPVYIGDRVGWPGRTHE